MLLALRLLYSRGVSAYSQTLTASITPASSMTKAMTRTIAAASITPSAAFSKRPNKAFVASIAPAAGALAMAWFAGLKRNTVVNALAFKRWRANFIAVKRFTVPDTMEMARAETKKITIDVKRNLGSSETVSSATAVVKSNSTGGTYAGIVTSITTTSTTISPTINAALLSVGDSYTVIFTITTNTGTLLVSLPNLNILY